MIKMQISFYKKTGLTPGVYPFYANWKGRDRARMFALRLWWSLLTVTFYRGTK